jgi:acetyl/propionyl-CoA carboxylase alpha subunit/acetyl-CoA carboxylase carboxyltransferase component
MVESIALVAAGQSASRMIRAVQETNEQFGTRLRTVVFYPDGDQGAPFLWGADRRVVVDAPGSALTLDALADALRDSGCDAVWLGWDAVIAPLALAGLCEDLKLTFLAATPDLLALLTDDVDGVEDGSLLEVTALTGATGAVQVSEPCRMLLNNGRAVLAESATALVSGELRQAARDDARSLADRLGGPVAVTVQLREVGDAVAVARVLPGLSPHHAVTEAVTGQDLVKLQLLAAIGRPVDLGATGSPLHAVQVRLDVEDPAGSRRVDALRLPSGVGVRADANITTGAPVPPGTAPLITLTATAPSRQEALIRLRHAVRDTTLVVGGARTTKPEILALLDEPETSPADLAARAAVALVRAAIDIADAAEVEERSGFLVAAAGGRPRTTHDATQSMTLEVHGRPHHVSVSRLGPRRYRVRVDDAAVTVELERTSPAECVLAIAGERYATTATAADRWRVVEVDGSALRIRPDQRGVVRAPSPAVVVCVPVAPGDRVAAGQPVAVLESMKLETAVPAPFAGRVREVLVSVNNQVDRGAGLVTLEPTGLPLVSTGFGDVVLPPHAARKGDPLAEVEALITGYDIGPDDARGLAEDYRGVATSDDAVLAREIDLLTAYTDLAELFRNRPATPEEDADQQVHSPREYFHGYLRSLDRAGEQFPDRFRARLLRALRHFGIADLRRTPELEDAVFRIFLAQQRAPRQLPVIHAILDRWLSLDSVPEPLGTGMADLLDRLILAAQLREPSVADLARAVRFRHFERPVLERTRAAVLADAQRLLEELSEGPRDGSAVERIDALVASPQPLIRLLAERVDRTTPHPDPVLEVLTRRYYRSRDLQQVRTFLLAGHTALAAEYELQGRPLQLVAAMTPITDLHAVLRQVADRVAANDPGAVILDLYLSWPDRPADSDELSARVADLLAPTGLLPRRITVTVCRPDGVAEILTFRPVEEQLVEDTGIRGLHPLSAQRLNLWRLKNFDGVRLPSAEDTYLARVVAKDNPNDVRLIAMAELRDVTPRRDSSGTIISFPAVEAVLSTCLDAMRRAQAQSRRPLAHNRIVLYAWPSLQLTAAELDSVARTAAPLTAGAGLEEITLLARLQDQDGLPPREVALRSSYRPGTGVVTTITDRPTRPMQPVDEYTDNVLKSRARSTVYPYELASLLAGPGGRFVEYDLDEFDQLMPVDRPPGRNRAGIIAGVVSAPTERHPEGMTRVVLFGDPTKQLGTVAEPECARVIAALDLAARLRVPVEWFALSSGARISMDSGTENMDWVSRALRRIITFTQAGGEINVVVAGINVGAQPYWNAEATMLMHTKGILVMTPDSAMVLTGKHSLDYSGGVSAEDNFGIGGYDRVMGPNGQAQYWAPNLTAAIDVLMQHYEHTYVAPGERWPRQARSSDPADRDVRAYPHHYPGSEFTTVGDIFSAERNPERKKPFDIRTLMRAVSDQDHPTLERWAGMADADTAVVFDAHLGGHPVALLGIESHALDRAGNPPSDGPNLWTAGTLFPRSSKKAARAINAASGNRPLVVLANLSGFDGSPESLRNLQLEYGAEIGRAIVNFSGPIVFCVVSRYHGGAFVVFSGTLNDNMEVLAVEGSYASVIGGAPAAAVVFSGDVDRRAAADPRIREAEERIQHADPVEAARLRLHLAALRQAVRAEKLGEVAAEFEAVHDIRRARATGAVHAIIPAATLRPRLIRAVERGIARTS